MKKTIIISLTILSIFLYISCSEDEDVKVKENSIESQLSFKKINLEELMNSRTWCGTIVEWDEWGRASQDCNGWGLCNADWFPPCDDQQQAQQFEESNNFGVIVEEDLSNSKHYIELYLDQPTNLPLESLLLYVDVTIGLNTFEYYGHNHTIEEGIYNFDVNLGNYGGYKIYLD